MLNDDEVAVVVILPIHSRVLPFLQLTLEDQSATVKDNIKS